MISGSVRIARLFGIDIRVHVSWVLIAVLIFVFTYQGVASDLPIERLAKILVAGVTTFLFFASVLLHELAHSIVARRFRLPVHSITLFVFGGVSNLRREPDSARTEFFMAIVGPLTSLLLAGIFALGTLLSVRQLGILSQTGGALYNMFSALAEINLLLAAFNMLPGYPLDGGRVLRSALWGLRSDRRWATRIATRGGQAVAGGLALWGAFDTVQGDAFSGAWRILIAFFLFNAASASYRQERFDESLRRVTVGALMTRELASVPPDLDVQGLVQMYVLPMRGRAFPVEDSGRLVGVVSVADVRRVPREEWARRRVADIMTPLDRLEPLGPEDDAQRGLDRLLRADQALLPVVEDGHAVGVFERDVVFDYLRTREELGLDRRRR